MALNFKPNNNYLLCKRVEVKKTTEGGIEISSEISKMFHKTAKIIETSPKLGMLVDDYKKGDVVIYPDGVADLTIFIDDEEYVMLKKDYILLTQRSE